VPGPPPAGLVVRLVRWGLPVALLVAAVVALLGLGGIVLSAPPEARPTPTVPLNLTRAPALPVADQGGAASIGGLVPDGGVAPAGAVAAEVCAPPPVCRPGNAAAPPPVSCCS
jgi:hypothetical protein